MIEPGFATSAFPDWLRQRARITPDRLALVVGGDESLTFAELNDAVSSIAAGLRRHGVSAGDRVGLLAANSVGYAKAVHAISRASAVLVPLNLRLTDSELSYQIEDAGLSLLLHDAERTAIAESLSKVSGPDMKTEGLSDVISGRAIADPTPDDQQTDLTAVHSVIYTSGTTGRPKGVCLTYGNHLWSAIGSALNLGLDPGDRWLACMPLYHVGGLSILLRGLIYGMTVQVQETFEAAAVNRAIDEDGVTLLSVVSTMLQRLLDERGGRLYPASLRCVLVGGGPVPPALLEDALKLGMPVVQTYGLTEAASQVATLSPDEALSHIGSAGKPLFATELRILSPDGAACLPDEPGEIAVRGATVTPGYLDRHGAMIAAARDGWLNTGDIGYLDRQGYLYVLDRRDDLIVSGGENVYPAEVEAALESHPLVMEAGVFGRADERWGQAVYAVVCLKKGAALTQAELAAFCRERLAGFKVPRRFYFDGPLPRTAAGKLLRRELRERWGDASLSR